MMRWRTPRPGFEYLSDALGLSIEGWRSVRTAHSQQFTIESERAIFGSQKIGAEVEIFTLFGVSRDAPGFDELAGGQVEVHDPRPRNHIAGLQLPPEDIVGHRAAVVV